MQRDLYCTLYLYQFESPLKNHRRRIFYVGGNGSERNKCEISLTHRRTLIALCSPGFKGKFINLIKSKLDEFSNRYKEIIGEIDYESEEGETNLEGSIDDFLTTITKAVNRYNRRVEKESF